MSMEHGRKYSKLGQTLLVSLSSLGLNCSFSHGKSMFAWAACVQGLKAGSRGSLVHQRFSLLLVLVGNAASFGRLSGLSSCNQKPAFKAGTACLAPSRAY